MWIKYRPQSLRLEDYSAVPDKNGTNLIDILETRNCPKPYSKISIYYFDNFRQLSWQIFVILQNTIFIRITILTDFQNCPLPNFSREPFLFGIPE